MSYSSRTGYIYALEREDLKKVYVGQTLRLDARFKEHRRYNKSGLFTDTGEPTFIVKDSASAGIALDIMEMHHANEYEHAGWEVVSKNTGWIGWSATDSLGISTERKSEIAREWQSRKTPEERAATARKAAEIFNGERRSAVTREWQSQKTEEWHEARAEKIRAAMARRTPEQKAAQAAKRKATIEARTTEQERTDAWRRVQSAGGNATSKPRRQCNECGMISARAPIGIHQKASGHSGYTDLPPPEGVTDA